MQQYVAQGEVLQKLLTFVLSKSNGKFMNIPENWLQTLIFNPGTVVLKQKKSGPCGLLACLQAYIIVQKIFDINSNDPYLPLAKGIIQIMTKFQRPYSFCDSYRVNNENQIVEIKYNVFDYSHHLDALNFLLNDDFKFLKKITLFELVLSFTFSAGPKLLSSTAFNDPFIFSDSNTSIQLVMLLLNGRIFPDLPTNEYFLRGGVILSAFGQSMQEFGIIDITNFKKDNILSDNSPIFKIWIVYYGGHFTTLAKDNQSNNFFEFDTYLNTTTNGRIVTPKHILWEVVSKFKETLDKE